MTIFNDKFINTDGIQVEVYEVERKEYCLGEEEFAMAVFKSVDSDYTIDSFSVFVVVYNISKSIATLYRLPSVLDSITLLLIRSSRKGDYNLFELLANCFMTKTDCDPNCWDWLDYFNYMEVEREKLATQYVEEDTYDVVFSISTNIPFATANNELTDMEEEDLIQLAIDKILANPREYITFDNFECYGKYNGR